MKWRWHPRFFDTLTRIEQQLDALTRQETALMATAQEVLDNEKSLGTAVGQLITLADDIKARLDAAIAAGTPTDPATLQAISDSIDVTKAEVVATIAKDTPATPSPMPPTP